MTDDDLQEIVENLRMLGSDLADVEVKRASRALPKSVRETLSSFSNTRGGILIFGLDEISGFEAVGVDDFGLTIGFTVEANETIRLLEPGRSRDTETIQGHGAITKQH